MDIQGTLALVTGANRGIRFALVQALLDRGAAKVYAAVRQDADLSRLVTLDTKRIMPVCLDVTDGAQLARVAARRMMRGYFSIMPGVLDFGSVLDAPAAAFKRNFDVNFLLYAPRSAGVCDGPHAANRRGREHPHCRRFREHAWPRRLQRVEDWRRGSTSLRRLHMRPQWKCSKGSNRTPRISFPIRCQCRFIRSGRPITNGSSMSSPGCKERLA